MSKAERNRAESARARIAAQQAAAKKADQRRVMLIAGGAVVVVLAVVLALVLVALNKKSPAQAGHGTLPASVVHDVTSVPASTLAGVGGGTVTAYNPTPVSAVSAKPLTVGGKPDLLYIGAEFCPYCAAQRWAMMVALSRFGSFTTPIKGIHSSATDAYPNTPTVTFYRTGYTSPDLTFTAVENEDENRNALQPVTSQQNAIWAKNSPSGQGYPFLYYGGAAVSSNWLVYPPVLKGLTWAQVAADLHDPSSTVGKAELGAANYITAGICKMTGNKPSSVCTAGSIPALEAKI